jgi:hypothetical protein
MRSAHRQNRQPQKMEILWLAILFYSIGLGAVLHFRPALMFAENGTWKEFGYHRTTSTRYTLFPFWLFAIVWAIVSYALAAAIVWAWSPATGGGLMAVAAPAAALRYSASPIDEEVDTESEISELSEMTEEEMPPEQTETIRMRPTTKRVQTPARQPRQGYYVLDPASEKSGLRRYIYYGAAPPPEVVSATTTV